MNKLKIKSQKSMALKAVKHSNKTGLIIFLISLSTISMAIAEWEPNAAGDLKNIISFETELILSEDDHNGWGVVVSERIDHNNQWYDLGIFLAALNSNPGAGTKLEIIINYNGNLFLDFVEDSVDLQSPDVSEGSSWENTVLFVFPDGISSKTSLVQYPVNKQIIHEPGGFGPGNSFVVQDQKKLITSLNLEVVTYIVYNADGFEECYRLYLKSIL